MRSHLGRVASSDKTSGPKPKTAFRHLLRVMTLDLYVAWLEGPELCLGVSMSLNYWNTSSRYNALHISKKIIPALDVAVLPDLATRRNFSRSDWGLNGRFYGGW